MENNNTKSGIASILAIINSWCNQLEKEAISSIERRSRKFEAENKILNRNLDKEIIDLLEALSKGAGNE